MLCPCCLGTLSSPQTTGDGPSGKRPRSSSDDIDVEAEARRGNVRIVDVVALDVNVTGSKTCSYVASMYCFPYYVCVHKKLNIMVIIPLNH